MFPFSLSLTTQSSRLWYSSLLVQCDVVVADAAVVVFIEVISKL